MKNFNLFLFVTAIVMLASCSAPADRAAIRIEVIEGPAPYSSLDVNNAPQNFQFAIVTDRTGGHRPGVFLDGIQKLNLLQPEFVMSVGDLIEGYTEDTVELNRQWTEFNGFIDSLKVPFFYVPGNHDITNKVMEDKWKSLFGKTYYHFVYKDVLFLCLNSEDNYRGAGKGMIGDEQYEWIKKTLEENQDVKWTLAFMHQPLWAQEAETLRWNDVETLLKGRNHTVFVGHRHNYVKYARNNGKYFVLATTGGGSRLRGTGVGEFDHVVWITMTDNGPIMANLLLEGIWHENVVTEEMYDFFTPLINKQPVKVSPVMTGPGRFTSGSAEVRITNDSDVPMEISLTILPSQSFSSSIGKRELTMAPNTVETLKLTITANAGAPETPQPLDLQAKVTYKPASLPAVKLDFARKIMPERKETLTKASAPRQIDGDLSDWGSGLTLRNNPAYAKADPFSHSGDADGSFRFGVAYDNDFVYIAAEVTDDEILSSPDSLPHSQDGFHVIFDGRAETVSAYAVSRGAALHIGQSPGMNGARNEALFRPKRLPEGTRAVTVATEKGYNTEIAIPISYIKEKQGDDWKTVRINAGISDFDMDYNHSSILGWKPDWEGEDTYAGSGLFYK